MELDRAAGTSRASQQWLASLSQGSASLPDASRPQNTPVLPAPPVHILPRRPPASISLRPNPKQNELPETDPSMSEAPLGTHKWKVAAYKSALQRKLPLVDRCSFIQHGLCHVCTATATTNMNPALVVNVCPYFDFGHSICVVHFERLARTLVSTMLEDDNAVAPCPICLHACSCVVCTRVVSKQVEQYDTYMASASSSQAAEAADAPPQTPPASLLQQPPHATAALSSVRVMNTSNFVPTTSANSWRTQLLASTSSDEQDKPVEPVSPRPSSAAKAAPLDDRRDVDAPKASAKQVARKPVLATKQAGPLSSPRSSSHDGDEMDSTLASSQSRRPSSDPMLEADSKESHRPDDVRTKKLDAGDTRKTTAKPSTKTNGVDKASAKESRDLHTRDENAEPSRHSRVHQEPDDHAEAKGTDDDVPRTVSLKLAKPAEIVAAAKPVVAPVQSFKETASQRKESKSTSVQPKAAAKATTSGEIATDSFPGDRRSTVATPVAEPKARTPPVLPYRSIAPKLASKAVADDDATVVAQPKADARPAKKAAKSVVTVSDLLQSNASPGNQGTFTLLLPPPSQTAPIKDNGSGVGQDSQPKPPIQPAPEVTKDQGQLKPTKRDGASSSQPRRVVKAKPSGAEKAAKPGVNGPTSPAQKPVAVSTAAIAPSAHDDAQPTPSKPNGAASTAKDATHKATDSTRIDGLTKPPTKVAGTASVKRGSGAVDTTDAQAQSKDGKAATTVREKKASAKATRPKEPTQVKAKPDAKDTEAPARDAKATKGKADAATAMAPTKAKATATTNAIDEVVEASKLSKTKVSEDATTSTTPVVTSINDKAAEVAAKDPAKPFEEHSSAASVNVSEKPTNASPHKEDDSTKSSRDKIDEAAATATDVANATKMPESTADLKQPKPRSGKVAQSVKSTKASRGSIPPSTMIYKRPSSKPSTPTIGPDSTPPATNDDAAAAEDSGGKSGTKTNDRPPPTTKKSGQDSSVPKKADALNVDTSDEDDASIAQPPLKRLKRADQSAPLTSVPSATPAKQPQSKAPGGKRQPVVAPTNVRERKPRAAAPPPGALINQHKNDDLVVAPPTKTPSRPAKATAVTPTEPVVDLKDVLLRTLGQPNESNSLKRAIGSTAKTDKDTDTSKRIRGSSAAAAATSSPVDEDSDENDDDEVEVKPATPVGGRAKKKAPATPSKPDKGANKAKKKPPPVVQEPVAPEPPAILDEEVDTNLDYCSVCKVDGDLVCCDVCPRSFHLACLNMREDELPDDNWQCHECIGHLDEAYVEKVCQDLSKGRNKASAMRRLLTGISDHPFAKPFLTPVEDVEYYDDVVKERMDLTTVATRLKKYPVDAGNVAPDFVSDVNLIWANCRLFNDEKSGLARAAKTLQADFKRMVDAAMSPARR